MKIVGENETSGLSALRADWPIVTPVVDRSRGCTDAIRGY
jgi:hypothetical protein